MIDRLRTRPWWIFFGVLPKASGVPFYPNLAGVTNSLAAPGTTGSSNRMTQNWQLGDDLTWTRGRHAFKAGETISLAPDPGRAHLFDTESGKTLMQ